MSSSSVSSSVALPYVHAYAAAASSSSAISSYALPPSSSPFALVSASSASAAASSSSSSVGSSPVLKTTSELISEFDRCWVPGYGEFEGIKFDLERFKHLLRQFTAQFDAGYNPETEYGYIEKHNVLPASKIYVRADLHGDLKSLIENLKALQRDLPDQPALLDKDFKCKENVHLVFLGDYADRGKNAMQILEILATLKREQPQQVTLIRGNHEDVMTNQDYSRGDIDLSTFVSNDYPEHIELLTRFYQRMPLTAYLGEKDESGTYQYVQFTHGFFELYVDPSLILGGQSAYQRLNVSKMRNLNERVCCIQTNNTRNYQAEIHATEDKTVRKSLKLLLAAQVLQELWEQDVTAKRDC